MTQVWTAQSGTLLRRALSVPTFVLGDTKPDETNTGISTGVALTEVNGSYTVSTAGVTIENKRFLDYVYVRAANVTFRNCEFVGPATTGFVTYGLVDCRDNSAQNTLLDRCSIHPQNPFVMWWVNGVTIRSGATVTINQCNVYHTVDGINAGDATGCTVKVHGCYIHDLAFFNNSTDHTSDAYHPYWTHNDCIQLSGDNGHEAIGCFFSANIAPLTAAGYDDGVHGIPSAPNGRGAGITVSPDKGPVTGLNARQNWFEGGETGYQNSALPSGQSSCNVGYLGQNRFAMNQYDFGGGSLYQIRYKAGNSYTGLTTNYFDPDAPSVPAGKKGVAFSVGFDTGIRVDP